MSNPYAPPSVNESKVGHSFLWKVGGYAFIAIGLMTLIMGGALFVHAMRLSQQARQEAMYQRDLAQKALEQAELMQKKNSARPARD